MPDQLCVDASFVIAFLLPHDVTQQTFELWQEWIEQGADLVSAPLFFAEVTSVLREHVYHKRIAPYEGEDAFATFAAMPVRSVAPADLQERAWALAKQYNRPKAYDAQYLAVAVGLGCELWTGDQRLVNAVHAPWVRWIGSHR